MGALVGLGFGLGLLLVWSAVFVPRTPRRAATASGRVGPLLARAGMSGTSVRSFLALCIGCGVLAFLTILVAARGEACVSSKHVRCRVS